MQIKGNITRTCSVKLSCYTSLKQVPHDEKEKTNKLCNKLDFHGSEDFLVYLINGNQISQAMW